MKTREMKVVVMVRRKGAPDFVRFDMSVSGEQVEQGLHYVLAKQQARDLGLEVVDAFDEQDPAFQWLAVEFRA